MLLYALIRRGNRANVTSLFHLVPVVTAIMDYLFLGNALSLLGMATILGGLVLVFRGDQSFGGKATGQAGLLQQHPGFLCGGLSGWHAGLSG